MIEPIYTIWDKFLDFLFPKSDLIIELEKSAIEGTLELPQSKETPHSFITSLWNYRDRRVRALVWAVKYKENRILTKYIGKIIYENILDALGDRILFENTESALLIPIPVSRKKLLEKGFNQTESIASAIKEYDDENVLTLGFEILKKKKDTLSQSKLPKSRRLLNLIGAFNIENPEIVAGKSVILVDDVTTTGSTLMEAKKVLESAGAKKVIAYTIAH